MLFFFVGWGPHCTAWGILLPRSGIEPPPLALEAWSLTHWSAREVPGLIFQSISSLSSNFWKPPPSTQPAILPFASGSHPSELENSGAYTRPLQDADGLNRETGGHMCAENLRVKSL